MKNILLIWLALLMTIPAFSQQVISSSGTYFTNAQGSIDYTLGEALIFTYQSSNNSAIYQGFQKGNQINVSVFASDDTICDGEQINLSAGAMGGNLTYSYNWSSLQGGAIGTGNTIQISPSLSDWYYVEVSDGGMSPNARDSIFIQVNPSSFGIAFTATPVSFSSPPFNVSIQNQTTNASHYRWDWNFGNGTMSNIVNPTLTYGYNGVYSIIAKATDTITNCFDTLSKIDYISCSGGGANPCNLVAEISPAGQVVICQNDSIKLTATSNPDANYNWIRNGVIISGTNDSIYYASIPGIYQVMLTDTICSEISPFFSLINYPTQTPIITSIGSITPCTNDSMELVTSSQFSSFLWNTGDTSSSIFVKQSGQYTVTTTDANACVNTSQEFTVNSSLIAIPDICIVGVDSATNTNQIIWQRTNNPLITEYRIYKETVVANQYQLLATKDISESSIYIDANSNPRQQAYRYKISAVDTCGNETPLSEFHKTNHLTINVGISNAWNLIWDGYEGFSFGSYQIYRGTDSTQMTLLTQIQSTLHSYTDINPPSGNVYYQIEVISPNSCYPDSVMAKASTSYNSSKSNMVNTSSVDGIENENLPTMNFRIYPNPNKGLFTIESFSLNSQNVELHIFNNLGSEVLFKRFNVLGKWHHKVNLQSLAKGMYIVRLNTSNNKFYYRKVIVY
jgi:hypothetical protein